MIKLLPAEIRFKILFSSLDNLDSIAASCKPLYQDITSHYFMQEKYYHIYKAILFRTIKKKKESISIDRHKSIIKGKTFPNLTFIDGNEKKFWNAASILRFHLLKRIINDTKKREKKSNFYQISQIKRNERDEDYRDCLQPIIFEMNHKYAKQLLYRRFKLK